MVQALDLTFDRLGEDRVRAEWDALLAAGLPSLARHTAPSNRPHLTLDTRDDLSPQDEAELGRLAARLPLPLRLGTPLLFHARRRWVVARHVVLDRALLDLHDDLHSRLGGVGGPLTAPGRWVPHVTLARGVSDDELPRVLALLATAPPVTVTALRLRHWDQRTGTARVVPGQSSTGRSL